MFIVTPFTIKINQYTVALNKKLYNSLNLNGISEFTIDTELSMSDVEKLLEDISNSEATNISIKFIEKYYPNIKSWYRGEDYWDLVNNTLTTFSGRICSPEILEELFMNVNCITKIYGFNKNRASDRIQLFYQQHNIREQYRTVVRILKMLILDIIEHKEAIIEVYPLYKYTINWDALSFDNFSAECKIIRVLSIHELDEELEAEKREHKDIHSTARNLAQIIIDSDSEYSDEE